MPASFATEFVKRMNAISKNKKTKNQATKMTKAEKHFQSFDYDVAFLQNRETKIVDQVVVLGFNEEGEAFHSEPIKLALGMRVLRKDGVENE